MSSDRTELLIVRRFKAPRSQIWKAFTDETALKQWWGPKGFTMLAAKLDFKTGGTFHFGMRGPDGSEFWAKFIFREVKPQAHLSFTNGFSDATGAEAPNPWMKVWPKHILNSFTFEEDGEQTVMTLRVVPLGATEYEYLAFTSLQTSMEGGYSGTFDKLDTYLAKQQQGTAR